MVYYGQYLREILRNLWEKHELIIPQWDFYISEGSDIIATLHYYVIGDPIALFSVLVPTRYMHYFYSFSCVLRLYLAGIAFSELAFGTGKKKHCAVLAGALSYVFCIWGLLNVARHPYFLNPMIYFPLMILGIEKILRKERPYLFVIIAAISAASNFYFFYMIAILAVVYALVRLAFVYGKNVRAAFMTLMQMGVFAVVGVAGAGVLLLPILMVFLQDTRMGLQRPFQLFYPLSYYSKLPSMFLSQAFDYWLTLGLTAPVLVALLLLFIRKGSRLLRTLVIGCGIVILFPIFGQLLNGMSYMSNRWIWAFVLLAAYILTEEWDALFSLSDEAWRKLLLCGIALTGCCLLFEKSRQIATYSALVLFMITLLCLRFNAWSIRRKEFVICTLVGVSIVHIAFWEYSPVGSNYANAAKENRFIVEERNAHEAGLVKILADETYTRYTGRDLTYNFNILSRVSSSNYYWTITNPYMGEYRTSMELAEAVITQYMSYDDRTAMIGLSAAKYYVTKDGNHKGIPYGYKMIAKGNAKDAAQKQRVSDLQEELGTQELTADQLTKVKSGSWNVYEIYENEYALPLGYCYDSYINTEQWEAMDAVEKEQIQLDAVYLMEDVQELSICDGEQKEYQIPYTERTSGAEITRNEQGYVTTAGNQKITLNFEGKENSEVYVSIHGLKFRPTTEWELYFGEDSVDPLQLYNETNYRYLSKNSQNSIKKAERFKGYSSSDVTLTLEASNGVKKTITHASAYSSNYADRWGYTVNLGYSEEPITSVTITLPSRGIYKMEKLSVSCVPRDDYAEKIAHLKEDTLENMVLGTDQVTGTLSLDETKILVMAIPYAKGWSAWVDGEPTEVLRANLRYMGILVPEGEHEIEFRYSMPFKKAGMALSGVGIVAFAAVIFCTERRRKNDGIDHCSVL